MSISDYFNIARLFLATHDVIVARIMPRKKGVTGKMFALVHWVGTANKDVYPLSSLPATARKLDAECTLDFVPKDRDGKELPAVQSAAKVLRIDSKSSSRHGVAIIT